MAQQPQRTAKVNLKTGNDETKVEDNLADLKEQGLQMDELEGVLHWNHSARVVSFQDGTFIAPGSSGRLTEDVLKNPIVKQMVKNGDLKTEEAIVPIEPSDELEPGNEVTGPGGEPLTGQPVL